ncbi:hypothetical protein Nepgr_026898 [Nepenthes gracilis]|uniref:Uncharacterized protein n=1 Tax=Nepenthes gracilis TaxID=150966 RepID=A0AAD3T7N1_NEPGR|nr:hypothetical protein Nepgr_026898 [Nepenthes gracilis]
MQKHHRLGSVELPSRSRPPSYSRLLQHLSAFIRKDRPVVRGNPGIGFRKQLGLANHERSYRFAVVPGSYERKLSANNFVRGNCRLESGIGERNCRFRQNLLRICEGKCHLKICDRFSECYAYRMLVPGELLWAIANGKSEVLLTEQRSEF